jgi:hypothetical protein
MNVKFFNALHTLTSTFMVRLRPGLSSSGLLKMKHRIKRNEPTLFKFIQEVEM